MVSDRKDWGDPIVDSSTLVSPPGCAPAARQQSNGRSTSSGKPCSHSVTPDDTKQMRMEKSCYKRPLSSQHIYRVVMVHE